MVNSKSVPTCCWYCYSVCSLIRKSSNNSHTLSPQCPVNCITWSPLSPDVFLSCSSDWTIQLWRRDHPKPVLGFTSAQRAVYDIKWSPKWAAVFGAVNEGQLEIWDLNSSMWVRPVCSHALSYSVVSVMWNLSQEWSCGSTLSASLLQLGPGHCAARCSRCEDGVPAVCHTDRLCPGRRQWWTSDCLPAQEPQRGRRQPGRTYCTYMVGSGTNHSAVCVCVWAVHWTTQSVFFYLFLQVDILEGIIRSAASR